MNLKYVNTLSLLLIIGFGLVYFFSINNVKQDFISDETLSFNYFPNLLVTALIILSVLSLVQNMKKKSEIIVIKNFKMIIFTIVLTALFIFCWYIINLFYVVTFIFLSILFIVYQSDIGWKKRILVSGITSLSLTLFIYIVFDVIMKINFSS